MKSYWGKKEVRFVGKAWEIRHRVRRLAQQENLPGTTVADVLKRRSAASSLAK
ncbi:Z-ring formation inhibitor MciZ [Paenibacillus alkalitolerans]|uniref:Z-ring formation inhibitor MciZ n=1 Tax=Paenibacillus alkalitolerans TaxID=2799335 RepID=UPI0018F43291|nr:Z-ring formation inhibitor MciZ [Paenibacillus alkalitolerans]